MSYQQQMRNRAIAIATSILWMLAIEVLPGLHLATHRADHTHAGPTVIVTYHVEGLEPAHDESVFHIHQRTAKPHALDGERTISHHLPHAADGVAHHALAILAAPPPITEPVPVALVAIAHEYARANEYERSIEIRPTARGPPTA